MKVAVSGTHGSGKSTLLDGLVSALTDHAVSFLPEVPRLLTEELGNATALQRSNNSVDMQSLITARQMADESLSSSAPLLVSDRSVVDHWAYTSLLFAEWARSAEAGSWKRMLRRWGQTYALTIYLPSPDWGSVDDGVREADVAFQRLVADRIRDLLDEFDMPYVVLSQASPDQRISESLDALQRLQVAKS